MLLLQRLVQRLLKLELIKVHLRGHGLHDLKLHGLRERLRNENLGCLNWHLLYLLHWLHWLHGLHWLYLLHWLHWLLLLQLWQLLLHQNLGASTNKRMERAHPYRSIAHKLLST